jgi:hypothetical protein
MNTNNSNYYHLQIAKKGNKNEYIYVKDLNYNDVINDYLVPYVTQNKFIADGHFLDSQEIESVKVAISHETWDSIEGYEYEKYNRPISGVINFVPYNTTWTFGSNKMSDVTRETTKQALESARVNDKQLRKKESNAPRRYFISHSSVDQKYADIVVQMLEAMGIASSDIFCSSIKGIGIPIGQNWKNWLYKELNTNTFVIFLLSENFYKSPVCLCEMGAAWVLSQEHAPILIPPMKFDDLKGVIESQGFMIDDNISWTELRQVMGLDKGESVNWERKKTQILGQLLSQRSPY